MAFDLPYLSGVQYESMVDGYGVRTAIYLSGCSHYCPGCHNPETHNPQNGQPITHKLIDQMAEEITKRPFIDGITLTGGDPLFDPYKALNFITELVSAIRSKGGRKPTIWLYTGFTYQEVMEMTKSNMDANVLINAYTDVLVEGRYDSQLADKTLAFRGSSNQRVIDIEKTIEANRIVLFEQS